MINFIISETVIIELTIKDKNGNLYDPATSVKMTLTDIRDTVLVDDQSMVKDSTGQYHYDFDSDDYAEGAYIVICRMVDGSRLKIERNSFNLVR